MDALLRRDLIRQVILPDSDACIPLFYAALRGVRMLTATMRRLKGLEKFSPEYISELLETPNSHGHTALHLILNAGNVATAACLLREGVRLTTDTDQSLGRSAFHSLAASDVNAPPMHALTDLLLQHPGALQRLDAPDAHGSTALSLAVKHNHTYLALQLLEKGASLTPEAGELLGLANVLKVPSILHSLAKAQHVRAIRWLIVRSESAMEVVLARDSKGCTPRDLVRLGTDKGHRIHAMLLAAEDVAMGLTDGYIEVGLTRPEDASEELQWAAYQEALKRQKQKRAVRCPGGCCDLKTCRPRSCGDCWSACRFDMKCGTCGSHGGNGERRRRHDNKVAPREVSISSQPPSLARWSQNLTPPMPPQPPSLLPPPSPSSVTTIHHTSPSLQRLTLASVREEGLEMESIPGQTPPTPDDSCRVPPTLLEMDLRDGGLDSSRLQRSSPMLLQRGSPVDRQGSEPYTATHPLSRPSQQQHDSYSPRAGMLSPISLLGTSHVGAPSGQGHHPNDDNEGQDEDGDVEEPMYRDRFGSDTDDELTTDQPKSAGGRISRHSDFNVLIAVRTDNFMSLDMVKDAIEGLGRREWKVFIRRRFGIVNCFARCVRRVRSWRARQLWQWCLTVVRQKSAQLARMQACRLVDLLRKNDMGSWVLQLPSSVDRRVDETLVVVSVSRDMMITLAEKAELFIERIDGRMMRFHRDDVDKFKQYSSTRLFDPSTSQALVLRQLRLVTSRVVGVLGHETLDDSIFFLHDHDKGSGRASVKAWLQP